MSLPVLALILLAGGLLNCDLFVYNAGASEEDVAQLMNMSIEDLLNMEVTSASKKAEKISEVPSNMVVITDQQIKEWGVKDLKEILRRVAGYNVVADRDEWCFGARGNVSDNNQKYLVMLDGHRMYSIDNFGPGNIIELPMDLANVKRIEIIKGPGSVVWGNAAISGVISIYTKEVDDLGDRPVHLSGAVGSHDTYRTNLQTGGKFEGGSWMFMGAGAKSGGKEVVQSSATSNRPILDTKSSSYGTDDPHGTYRTDLDRQDPGSMGHFKLKLDKFSFNGFYLENATFNRHYESTWGRENFLQNRKYFIEGVYEDELAGGTFSLRTSYHYNYAKYDNRQEVVGLPPAQLEIEWVDDNANIGAGYARELIENVLSLNTGLEFTRTNLGPDDKWVGPSANLAGSTVGPNTGAANVFPTATIAYTPGGKKRDNNLFGYALLDWHVTEAFKFVSGTGLDYSDDRGNKNLAFSPRLAGIYNFNSSTIGKLIYNHAFLRPSNFQSGVEAEEMDQVEGILIKNFGKTNVTATAYWQKLKGFISIVSIGTGYQNSGDYTSWGLELEANSEVTENAELWGNLSYVNASAKNFSAEVINNKTNTMRIDPEGQVLSVPSIQSNLGATFRCLNKKAFVSPALRFVGETKYRSAPPTTAGDLNTATYDKIDPMTYLDLALGYEPCESFGLYATFMNLLDEKKQNHLTIWNGTVGQYGLYAELKAIFKF
ncbi:TonB-dependent receptor plug domain-containing protein [Planctomycetota bacterium]